MQNVGEDQDQLELSYTAGGKVKLYIHFRNHVFYFVKG